MKIEKMLGKKTAACPYGCCKVGPQQRMKRLIKRRERQIWKRELVRDPA